MDHIKTIITWAKANKQKSVIIVIVVIAKGIFFFSKLAAS